MFEVRATFPMPENMDEFARLSDEVELAARPSIAAFAGSGVCRDMYGGREISFHVIDFVQAVALKQRLEVCGVPELIVRLKEQ